MLNNLSSSNQDKKFPYGARRGERSFSLLETIVAVSLVAILMVEVSGVHGNSIAFNQYGRKVLQASYLAKRIMSQIEYQATIHSPLKDIAIAERDKPFEDDPEFTYTVAIEPLPHAIDLMFKIFSGGMLDSKDDDKDKEKEKDGASAGAVLEQMKGIITQSVGDDPIWIAKVDVNWTEGARKENVSLAMVITDVKKLEDSVGKVLDIAQVTATPAGTTPPGPASPPSGGGGALPGSIPPVLP